MNKCKVDNISNDGCLSIRIIAGEKYQRMAFCPGQWDALHDFAPSIDKDHPDEWAKVIAAWAEENIAAWQAKQAEEDQFFNT